MAFSGTGRATVISLKSGHPLSQSTEGKSQSILSEPALITLQSSPSQISSFQKQGDDLILNLHESDTLRYQNFFTEVAGQQSKMLFQQGSLFQEAQFSTDVSGDAQTVTTLTPVWQSPASATTPMPFPASPESDPALSIVESTQSQILIPSGTPLNGAAVALRATTSEADSTLTLTPQVESATASDAPATSDAMKASAIPLPALTLDPVTGDNAVSYQEGIYGIIFTGSAAHLPSGTPVELTLDGRTWQGSVYQDQWQVQLSDSDVKTIKDGNHTILVSATDLNGNSTSLSQNLLLITHYNSSNPKVTVNDITLADAVQHDGQTWYVISGTLEAPLPLKTFAVQVSDTFHWNYAVVEADGSWRAEISASELSQGGNFLSFGVLDGAGNWFEQSGYVTADLTSPVSDNSGDPLPPVTPDNPTDGSNTTPVVDIPGQPAPEIDTPFGDGWLNRAEKKEGSMLTGTTGVTGSGQTVSVIIGGKHHNAAVSDDGHWSLPLAPGTMKTGFGKGQHDIVVTASDAAGHTATITTSYQVDVCAPKIAFTHLTEGQQINLASSHDQHVSGTGEAGDIVTVRPGDHEWQTSVTSKGTWAVQLETLDALTPEPGEHRITATIRDAAGNVNHVSQNVELYMAEPQPKLSIATAAQDNLINATTVISSNTEDGSNSESHSAITLEHASLHPDMADNLHLSETVNIETLSLLYSSLHTSLNGAADDDSFQLNGAHEAFDFATLGLRSGNAEVINLGAFSSNSVNLGQKEPLPMNDNASESPTIKDADGNVVTLSNIEGGVWSEDGQRISNGQQYDLYHNASASHEGSLADILMQHNLHLQLA
ncbi:BapA prefix-like domain-containing protein [Pantoea agglomerans]|uniref:BapA prefix-like domain-containing protein n=1 Tax=Enterobacter agglomerans TaxID=549 RepID=UPI002A6B4A4E|nr:BapA prefix-like domain-containing protein [Pantoea agglomerans]MDY0998176.1 BapA prefix-like domain-containing protein [Pantoea agglomerans]